MKVIFFGTPPFAAETLRYLLEKGINVVAVISKPDRPKGRSGAPSPTPVKIIALNHRPPIPLHQPPLVSAPDFAATLQGYQADLFVVVAYGEIIKQHLLDMPRLGCINVHASLLPKYRGAAPIQRCIINGEKETGVTIMHMVKQMDAGDMIEVAKVPIPPEMTYGELEQSLLEAGKKTLLKVIQEVGAGNVKRIPQDHTQATLAPKIELEDCEIRWDQPAEAIHNLIRGVNPHPGAWCYVNFRGEKKRLKILRSRVQPYQGSDKPGTILPGGALLIATGKDALVILELQLEGKKAMKADDFLRGIPLHDILLNTF